MTAPEYLALLSGLLPDTPLGRVMAIRAEKDPKAVARMSAGELAARSRWEAFHSGKSGDTADLQKELAAMFSNTTRR